MEIQSILTSGVSALHCWWGQSKLWIGVGTIKSEFSIINLIKIAVWPWLHFMFIWSIFITWLVILPFRNISEASEWMIMISWPQLIAYSGVMWKLVQWNVIRQLSNPWNSSRVLFKLRVVIHTPVGTETQDYGICIYTEFTWVSHLLTVADLLSKGFLSEANRRFHLG